MTLDDNLTHGHINSCQFVVSISDAQQAVCHLNASLNAQHMDQQAACVLCEWARYKLKANAVRLQKSRQK